MKPFAKRAVMSSGREEVGVRSWEMAVWTAAKRRKQVRVER